MFRGETQIGYLRLRHGAFTAEYPACGGRTVSFGAPEGDGMFTTEERGSYLAEAVA